MTALRRLRRLASVLLVGLVLVAGAALATGRIAHVSTNGVSMQPTYFAGDLVVVAKAGHYEVGDIAAYRVPHRKTLVLHRIVDGNGRTGFTMKGDNNQSIDPYTPRADEIVGRAVLHVPKVGKVLASVVTRGLTLAFVLVVLGVMTVTPNTSSTTNNTNPPKKPAHRASAPTRGSRAWKALLALDAILLLALATAQVLHGARSAPKPVEPDTPPSQTIDLSYGGTVAASDTYPAGTVATGDPVFTRLLDRVDVHLDYGTDAPKAVAVTGEAQLDLRLATSSGWHTTQPLAAAAPIEGTGHLELGGTLALADLRALANRVAEETGTSPGTLDVTVVASGKASLAGTDPVDFEAELPLQLTAQSLTMAGEAKTTTTDDGPVVRKAVAFKTAPMPKVSAAGGRDLRTPLLIALLLAIAATAVLWPTNDDDRDLDPAAITGPQVLRIDLPVTTARIQVADRAAVDAIARAAARPVIVGTAWEGVLTAEAVYWCAAGTAGATATPPTPPGAPSARAAASTP